MKISNSTQLLGLRPEVLPGLMVVAFYFSAEDEACTLLAVSNGAHTPGSLHYSGLAFDIDLPDATEADMIDYESDLNEILGREYTVVFQGTHLHIHWQPRTGVNRT